MSKYVFRKEYKSLPNEATEGILKIKQQAEALLLQFEAIKNREMSLAITNLEQSIMWATKAIVLECENE
jgi:hypothetical protein